VFNTVVTFAHSTPIYLGFVLL